VIHRWSTLRLPLLPGYPPVPWLLLHMSSDK
jgi:hypothetical protein